MDYRTAQVNMIEQQIRPWNVLTTQTLEALHHIRREDFVPFEHHKLAFADLQIPLGDGEVMLEPKVSARMLEVLYPAATDRVLNVGTGSGYLAALLASVCTHVTTVEINPLLCAQAQSNIERAQLTNITLEEGDGHCGWGQPQQFDCILIGGSLPKVTQAWVDLLADGGKLVGIEGHLPAMQTVRISKTGAHVVRKSMFETCVPRLHNIIEKRLFEF